ncbi:pyridoxamine 5'-phosphate oxidase family protein [Streptomyces sp. H10-C2]|uniref:pyridoxamine 5'-phosphate oxidase family protein n=1 Tax=unclassified Streptomyces TaxID=2593676 RepID=UPI0024BA2E6B|nr:MULTISPECIES: pyridoxamine 5'-phosphate oxidase family protein [unclassified Streptomyces]MDJ0342036.1 pyridoxamine 5'-phosphate oxidase family protein [Streptomyces sp. PH10-H1]MDJ0368378.1 pyridoxamine 5'-phosphate oxidase family protein [Streptomyces sp. H10-C2]
MQEDLGTVARADRFYDDQVRDRLNPRMRAFVARQEMFFLSTADRRGDCDSTFRAGPPGFVQVLDDKTLAYPEYRGNGVMASLGNIRENPHVGMLLIDFARDRIGLHVNGRALLIPDERMRAAHPNLPVDPVPGRRPQIWVEVEVEEAYIHCSKHIPRLVKVPLAGSAGSSGSTGSPGRSGALGAAVGSAGPDGGGRPWGTDDVRRKGGDYFGAAEDRVPASAGPVPAAPPVPAAVKVPVAVKVIAPVSPLVSPVLPVAHAPEQRSTGRRRRFLGWFS